MKIGVVDDRADALAGRAAWLRSAGHVVEEFTFEAALAATCGWGAFDRVVLDGRDDRMTVATFGEFDLPDRFLGPRVARHIRSSPGGSHTVLILVSIHARTHEELSLRCQQSGVDYAFDFRDIDSAESFVAVVEDPDQCVGSAREPSGASRVDVLSSLDVAEANPAGPELVTGERGVATGHQRRTIRTLLGGTLDIDLLASPTNRERHPHARELRPRLRALLGLDLDDKVRPYDG